MRSINTSLVALLPVGAILYVGAVQLGASSLQDLALALYETGNGDAQYFAGLLADGALMTKRQLDGWARGAVWQMVSEYTVPWVATESPFARDRALKWIQAKSESVAASGWNTYSGHVTVTPDDQLDNDEELESFRSDDDGDSNPQISFFDVSWLFGRDLEYRSGAGNYQPHDTVMFRVGSRY